MTTETAVSTWTIDPTHTIVAFAVQHMGLSSFRGRFRTVEGTITLDESRPESSAVSATIDATSIDVIGERFLGHMMREDFFHTDQFPSITFQSTRVTRGADDRHWSVAGDLTIRGTTREVTLALEYLGTEKHPFSGKTVAGFRAETTIDRGDFGLTWNVALESGAKYVGERVTITLEIEAIRSDEG